MKRFFLALVCAVVVFLGASTANATVRCWGIAVFQHGTTQVVFRSDRSGKTEKAVWAKILFDDFTEWEMRWKKEHPGQTLQRVHKYTMAGKPSNAAIVCGTPTMEVVKWPLATYPKPHGLAPSVAWTVPSAQPRAFKWDQDSGGWVITEKNQPTWSCKVAVTYRVRDGEDLSEARVLVQEKDFISGPQSYADSQIRASVLHGVMRLARGKHVLVGEVGACWAEGSAKPSAPSDWPASETW